MEIQMSSGESDKQNEPSRETEAGRVFILYVAGFFFFFLKATIHLTKTFCQTEGYKKVVTCPENGGIKTPDKNYNRIRFRSKVYD